MGGTMTEPRADRRNLRAADVLDLTEATYRQLDHWCTTYGICGDPRPGQGTNRLFTITEARVARALYLIGVHGVTLGIYARAIHSALHAQPLATHLVLAGDKASAHTDLMRALEYVTRANTTATVIPLRFAR